MASQMSEKRLFWANDYSILGIETSCDESAASVVRANTVLSSVISTQGQIHSGFGGVVPELASREHERVIISVIDEALKRARISNPSREIDAIAVTKGPGLMGSLLVGVAAAKSLSLAWGVPLVGVDHMEGHIFASSLETYPAELPAMVLLVSGGHTQLIYVSGPGSYQLVGTSIDDAAGEAFDKVARLLGLGFPGGPAIDLASRQVEGDLIRFPRAMLNKGYDFSFSGLKTAVLNYLETNKVASPELVAASFQEAVIDVLVKKTFAAAKAYGVKSVVLGGGVAANSRLRHEVSLAAQEMGIQSAIPAPIACTDNGSMIAAAGAYRLAVEGPSDPAFGVEPSAMLKYYE